MDKIFVFGASGQAKVVIEALESQERYTIAGLIESFKAVGELLFGYPVLGKESDLPELMQKHQLAGAVIAVGDNHSRVMVAKRILDAAPACKLVNVIHPSARISKRARLGNGVVVLAGAHVGPDAQVGDLALVNTNAVVEHDCVLEQGASLSPGAVLCGGARLGRMSCLGPNATVLEKRSVGPYCVVGAGSVVTTDLPDHVTAYGLPAKAVRGREESDPYLT